MNAASKIERLLQITGTPPDRKDLARSNYNRLLQESGEQAIDKRLAEFESMQEEVSTWRGSRHRSVLPIPSVGLVREKVSLRRAEEIIDALTLRSALIGREAEKHDLNEFNRRLHRIVIDFGASAHIEARYEIRDSSSFSQIIRRLIAYFATRSGTRRETSWRDIAAPEKIWELYRDIFEVSALPHTSLAKKGIDTEQAIAGLGNIAVVVKDASPDVIFTLNKGGEMVGAFIEAHLKLNVPVIPLAGNVQVIQVASNSQIPRSISRPIVVDDVARSGGTITSAFSWITNQYPGTSPRAVTMAASVNAIELIGDRSLITFNPTEDNSVRVPYDSSAGFSVIGSNQSRSYVFGAHSMTAEGRLIVPVETMDKVVAERRRVLSVES